jgi:hypothetical protein
MVCEVVEAADVCYRARGRPVEDFLDVSRVWRGAIASEDMTEESCFRLEELTFVDVEDQIGVGKSFEDEPEVFDVFL